MLEFAQMRNDLPFHLQKNSTSVDNVTVFTGASDIRQFGLIDKFNGLSHLTHWKTEKCNRLNGSDGSIFPPHITPNTTLYVYEKDLCRLLPLRCVSRGYFLVVCEKFASARVAWEKTLKFLA